MLSIITSESITESLKYVDKILTTLSSNPSLFSLVNRTVWFLLLIVVFYIAYNLVLTIFKRIDKKRCDQCMDRSLTTIAKVETLMISFRRYLENREL